MKHLKNRYSFLKETNSNVNNNFWEWFGDSTILNDDGTPKVVYHGSSHDFKEFDLKNIGSNTDSGVYGSGFYFSSDKQYASTYDRKRSSKIYEVYLKIENPLIINDKEDIPKIDVPYETIEDIRNATNEYSMKLREYLIDNNYDGIIDNISNKQIVALYPTQIKSIHNDGSWDKNDKNIYS